MNIIEILSKQSRSFLIAFGFVLVLFIGVFDYLTGPEFSSLMLYLVPVIFVTWAAGRWAGICISIGSATVWVVAEVASRQQYPHMIIPFWNLTEKLCIFFIVVYILLRLKKGEERSKRLERERKDMISMFAHDMKNPLIITGGFLSRLISGKAGPLTEKQLNYMELMRDELQRLEKYIKDFLEFSKLESEGYKPTASVFNIAAALKMHVERERILAEKKDINIKLEILKDTAVMVSADPVQIDRVITNLIDNAIKYTEPKGTITVKLLDSDKNVIVQVLDTGTGIRIKFPIYSMHFIA